MTRMKTTSVVIHDEMVDQFNFLALEFWTLKVGQMININAQGKNAKNLNGFDQNTQHRNMYSISMNGTNHSWKT